MFCRTVVVPPVTEASFPVVNTQMLEVFFVFLSGLRWGGGADYRLPRLLLSCLGTSPLIGLLSRAGDEGPEKKASTVIFLAARFSAHH